MAPPPLVPSLETETQVKTETTAGSGYSNQIETGGQSKGARDATGAAAHTRRRFASSLLLSRSYPHLAVAAPTALTHPGSSQPPPFWISRTLPREDGLRRPPLYLKQGGRERQRTGPACLV